MNQPGLVVAVGCLVVILGGWFVPAPATKVVFLDVGQGDAILLQSGTQQVLIDGGPDATVLQRLGEELPWADHTIDVVIATHPDKDHIAGLVHVLERYDVGLVLLPEIAHTSQLQSAWLDHIKEVITNKDTRYQFAIAEQQLHVQGLDIEVLHPPRGQVFGKKTNNGSVSTRVEFCPRNPKEGGCLSLLLTGDAEGVTERQLVAEYGSELDVDILKAGHHGSKTSTSQEFLAAASPQTVVISAGRDNQYGHPHPDVMERLTPYRLWRTDEQGSIRFQWNQGKWLASAGK